jgi:hypothetical protein
VDGSGRRLAQTLRRAAAPLILYPSRFGTQHVRHHKHRSRPVLPAAANVLGRPSPRAEPHNLYTLTAEIESPTRRAESAIRSLTLGIGCHAALRSLVAINERDPPNRYGLGKRG